ncbi:hypothetical protein [Nocardia nova]|uniref:hypothetical protein n=1 Tax=Nocardia nova TaxID=37330 RepID=UPI00273935E0|nr:hypothetical protein [Nocardia nova]
MNFEISIHRSATFRQKKWDLFTPAMGNVTLAVTGKMRGFGTSSFRLLLDDELKATLS